jgi:hypothetical protein
MYRHPQRPRSALWNCSIDDMVELRDEDAVAVDDHPAVVSCRFPALSAGSSRRVPVQEQKMTRVLKKRRMSLEAPVSKAQMFEDELRPNSDPGAEVMSWTTSMLRTQMTRSLSASTSLRSSIA